MIYQTQQPFQEKEYSRYQLKQVASSILSFGIGIFTIILIIKLIPNEWLHFGLLAGFLGLILLFFIFAFGDSLLSELPDALSRWMESKDEKTKGFQIKLFKLITFSLRLINSGITVLIVGGLLVGIFVVNFWFFVVASLAMGLVYLLVRIMGKFNREKSTFNKISLPLTSFPKLIPLGALFMGSIFLAIIVTIPSRWKIQKDLENIKTGLKETTQDIKILCDNRCNPPYPGSLEKFLLVSGSSLSEKQRETCNQNCGDIKEMQKSWGLEFIYREYPYMKDNRYYFYSSMTNCLFGLGGCPTAFLKEELGL